jgi:hypothetical protein
MQWTPPPHYPVILCSTAAPGKGIPFQRWALGHSILGIWLNPTVQFRMSALLRGTFLPSCRTLSEICETRLFLFFSGAGMESRASGLLGQFSTTELLPQPKTRFWMRRNNRLSFLPASGSVGRVSVLLTGPRWVSPRSWRRGQQIPMQIRDLLQCICTHAGWQHFSG